MVLCYHDVVVIPLPPPAVLRCDVVSISHQMENAGLAL